MSNTADRIWELARAFQPSRIVLSAVELGVFAAIGDGSATSVQVAERIDAEPRATGRLMNALVALGLLAKDGDLFSNTDETRELLVPGKPGYIGGALGHAVSLWQSWSTLTDAVRAGHAVLDRQGADRERFVVPFIAAMHTFASAQAQEIISQIDLGNVRRVLDVGGGSGAYSIAMCNAKADLEAVIFDQPDVVPLTQKYAAEAGLADRISTVTGDFNVDELPSGFDLAFLSQVLHSNSREECAELIKRAWRALNPGGRIVVQEFVIDENRASPPQAAMFSLNMLVGTPAGDTYTEREIRAWLEDAGFVDIRRIDPEGTGTTMLVATKPPA